MTVSSGLEDAQADVLAALTYDDRYWNGGRFCGHIGSCFVDAHQLVYVRSYADPFQGTNPERLEITCKRSKVRLRGYKDDGCGFDFEVRDTFASVLGQLVDAAAGRHLAVHEIVAAFVDRYTDELQ